MSGYGYITLAQARAILSARLQDPGNSYWATTELNANIIESLRTWQAYTQFYREREEFTSTSNIFYDLTQILTTNPTTVPSATGPFNLNVTDTDVINAINYSILEPQPLTGLYTDQYSLAQIQAALQSRRDRFLGDSGCLISRVVVNPAVVPASTRCPIPDNIIDIRRAAWINAAGNYSTLWRDDNWSVNNSYPLLQAPTDPPQVYYLSDIPPVTIAVYPPPLNNGIIELLTVQSGSPLPNPPGTVLGVPDDFAWVTKFGTLSDLFSADGQDRDPQRAKYCEDRFVAGVQLCRYLPSVMEASINGIDLRTGSVWDLDTSYTSWQNPQSTVSQPWLAAMTGRNMLALGPVPVTGLAGYGITVDISRNMPIPRGDGDGLQIGRDQIGVILDYAQHISCLKMGGEEFSMTMKLYQNFVYQAGLVNHRIRQLAFYNDAIRQPAIRLSQQTPRLEIPESAQYETTASQSI